jgi:DNA-binding CsgD family transcriptional regulator
LWLLSFGMLNAAAGQPAAARDCASSLSEASSSTPWAEAAASWLRGLAAECIGDLGDAEHWLDEAATQGMAELRIHTAVLWADLARVRRASGDSSGTMDAQRRANTVLAGIEGAGHLIGADADPFEALSGREREVVGLLSQGMSYAQIAQELYLSRSTVAFHLSNIYAKTGTTSRHEVIELLRRS